MQSTSNAVSAAARNGNHTPGSGGGGNGSGNGNGNGSQNPWAQRDTGSYFPVVNGYNGDGNGNWERDVESGRGVGGSNYNAGSGGVYGGNNTGRDGLREFETSLPLRLDYEACLAYLFLPPAGGVLLLVLERKSDYVRLVKRKMDVERSSAECGMLMMRIGFMRGSLHCCLRLCLWCI